MSRSSSARKKPSRRRRRRTRGAGSRPGARLTRTLLRRLAAAPLGVRLGLGAAVLFVLWLGANGVYQVVRKPAELFFPVSGALLKTPQGTWRQYQRIFRAHATAVVTPELLAALAQVEGGGDPLARTYWRWSWSWNPFEIYRPASSAVGMYQITDGTFQEAKRYCIHDHRVVEAGPWYDLKSCWFNALYARVVPSHAAELTSAYLDRRVAEILARHGIAGATPEQKQNLAAVIHLCGAGAGGAYAARGFRLGAGRRCGDHDVRGYLGKVSRMKRRFARLAAAGVE